MISMNRTTMCAPDRMQRTRLRGLKALLLAGCASLALMGVPRPSHAHPNQASEASALSMLPVAVSVADRKSTRLNSSH